MAALSRHSLGICHKKDINGCEFGENDDIKEINEFKFITSCSLSSYVSSVIKDLMVSSSLYSHGKCHNEDCMASSYFHSHGKCVKSDIKDCMALSSLYSYGKYVKCDIKVVAGIGDVCHGTQNAQSFTTEISKTESAKKRVCLMLLVNIFAKVVLRSASLLLFNPKYRLKIVIKDRTDHEFFTLWDSVCKDLFKKTATEMCDKDYDETDPSNHEEFKELLGKEMMFKVSMKYPDFLSPRTSQNSNSKVQLNVLKICIEEEIISKYSANIKPSETSDILDRTILEDSAKISKADSTNDNAESPLKIERSLPDCEVVEEFSTKRNLFDEDHAASVTSKKPALKKIKLEKE